MGLPGEIEMRGFNILPKIRIGTKLGISMGIGVLLVAGMLVNERISSASVAQLNADANRQQNITLAISRIAVVLRRAQVVGRDLRMARTADQVDNSLTELQRIVAQGAPILANLEATATAIEGQARFQAVRQEFDRYVAALTEIGKKQTDILTLFEKRDQADTNWLHNVNIVLNSVSLAMATNSNELETFINSASLAYRDARTAAWRYFVLNEASQIKLIGVSTEHASQNLNFARRATGDEKNLEGIDGLLTIISDFTQILKETTAAIDQQNSIQTGRANRAEAQARGEC